MTDFTFHEGHIKTVFLSEKSKRWYAYYCLASKPEITKEINLSLSCVHRNAFINSSEYFVVNLSTHREPIDLFVKIQFPTERSCKSCKLLVSEGALFEKQPELNDQGTEASIQINNAKPQKYKIEWNW